VIGCWAVQLVVAAEEVADLFDPVAEQFAVVAAVVVVAVVAAVPVRMIGS
jgi:hypothetical protein